MAKIIRPFSHIKVKTLAARVRPATVLAVNGNSLTARIGTATNGIELTAIADPDRVGRFMEGNAGPVVSGGVITDFNGFRYHTFLNSGDLIVESETLNAEVFVVSGGGNGGERQYYWSGRGGGAGGYKYKTLNFPSGTHTVAIGGGGGFTGWEPVNGSNSLVWVRDPQDINNILDSAWAWGGGGAADPWGVFVGGNGGSGGGGGGLGTPGQGNDGGVGNGGGGGASQKGQDGQAGGTYGGMGTAEFSEWGLATGTGEVVDGLAYFAGGGAAVGWDAPVMGQGGHGGGGGNQRPGGAGNYPAGISGLQNTGGGAASRGNGGSGIVIIRYPI